MSFLSTDFISGPMLIIGGVTEKSNKRVFKTDSLRWWTKTLIVHFLLLEIGIAGAKRDITYLGAGIVASILKSNFFLRSSGVVQTM